MAARVRPTIERMSGYTPGEQPGAGERVVKLNTNENPFPPSPRVMEAIRALSAEELRRYPHPAANPFRLAAAKLHGLPIEQVIAGNGSDDILAIAVRTFVGPGEVIACPEPGYSLYPVLADISEARTRAVPWDDPWRLPVEALLATGARAIFFANPNAPSGTMVPQQTISALAQRAPEVLVLVDEAYVDFADPGQSCLDLPAVHPNVVVSRTLSKGYGLAGLRLGYAVANPAVIEQMMKVKDSYNCDALSIAAGRAALEDRDYAAGTWQAVREERDRLSEELGRRGFQVIPSQANFLLATVPGGDGAALYLALKARGILVRFFDKPGLSDKIRVTIGRREENDALLAALGS
jgi:histidinol-phosphate aminotransferase